MKDREREREIVYVNKKIKRLKTIHMIFHRKLGLLKLIKRKRKCCTL